MNEKKIKKEIIKSFEYQYYPLSNSVKEKMMDQLAISQLTTKLREMAKMPSIVKYGA